jgi:hypothetical protein
MNNNTHEQVAFYKGVPNIITYIEEPNTTDLLEGLLSGVEYNDMIEDEIGDSVSHCIKESLSFTD